MTGEDSCVFEEWDPGEDIILDVLVGVFGIDEDEVGFMGEVLCDLGGGSCVWDEGVRVHVFGILGEDIEDGDVLDDGGGECTGGVVWGPFPVIDAVDGSVWCSGEHGDGGFTYPGSDFDEGGIFGFGECSGDLCEGLECLEVLLRSFDTEVCDLVAGDGARF